MKIKILSAGPLSTIQDEGRKGYLSSGISSNGVMDYNSMAIANVLVGNKLDEGVIETTYLGITAEFDCDSVIALTGAECLATINQTPVETYTAISVKSGDVLKMKSAISGMRSYVAVAGGFDISKQMGSVSTDVRSGIGGINGNRLSVGDEIPLTRSVRLIDGVVRKLPKLNDYKNEIEVRVVLGPQADKFTKKGINDFLSNEYLVSEKSDRMGIRLEGKGIESINGVDIISDGIAFGSIQISSSGMPIIMMADRQTTGGYAKIATVITVDLPLIAQLSKGAKIKFKKVSLSKAVSLLKKRDKQFKNYIKTLNG